MFIYTDFKQDPFRQTGHNRNFNATDLLTKTLGKLSKCMCANNILEILMYIDMQAGHELITYGITPHTSEEQAAVITWLSRFLKS